MKLYDEIRKNAGLRFIDERQPHKILTLMELDRIGWDQEEPQSMVFLYLDNSLESVSVLLSGLNSHHTLALQSTGLTPEMKEQLETLYNPAYIYDRTREEIPEYVPLQFNGLWRRKQAMPVLIHKEIKVLLSTSGTTGSPKFVKLSEANLLQNARSIAAYLPILATDVTPLNLPVYYSYGLSVLTSNALQGGTIVCTNTDMLSKVFWTQMEQLKYTSVAGVPFVYEMLNRIGFTKNVYPSLRYMTQAGGRLPEVLVTKFATYARDHGVDFFVMYGQTEATARMSYLPPGKVLQKPGSIGIPVPGGRFAIEESTGELKYSGENVSGGYVSSREDLADFHREEWLYTGDLARMDEEGYFYITGRMKRFVKLFGSRINLDEVESILSASVAAGITVLGVEDKFMLLSGTDAGLLQDATAYLVKVLKLHPSVIKTFVCPDMPLTANGKPDYKSLMARYEQA